MNYFIVNYNTSILVNALISNIQFIDKAACITVLDNSDKEQFTTEYAINVLDNTKGQIIDFDSEWKNITDISPAGNGSWKHAMSIEWFYNFTNEPFMLLDSDVIIKQPFEDIIKDDILFAGDISGNRVMPMFLYINVPLCKEHNVHFFDKKTITPFKSVDTGYYFLEQCKKYKVLSINMFKYIFHFGGASYAAWCKPNYKTDIFGDTFGHSKIEEQKRFIYHCRKYIPDFERILE